jgi:hypothetical protein
VFLLGSLDLVGIVLLEVLNHSHPQVLDNLAVALSTGLVALLAGRTRG